MSRQQSWGLLAAAGVVSISFVLPAPPADAQEALTLRFAGQHPPDHMGTRAIEAIAAQVEEQTDGRITFRLHPAGELGDYTLIYDELIRGTVDMALISAPAQHDERIEAQWLPFIAEDHAAVRQTFGENSLLSQRMREYHGEVGVEFLSFFGEGFIGLGATQMPENAAEPGADKDMLVRVAPFRPAELVARDLGFRASTIPYADTYGALQTGVVEGWIGGSANLNYTGFRDVITHFLPYNVFYEATSIFVSRETWDALSPEDQEIVREAVLEQSRASFETAEREDEEYLDQMREAGIEVVTFTDEERRTMAEHVRANTWPQLEDRLGSELIEMIREELQN